MWLLSRVLFLIPKEQYDFGSVCKKVQIMEIIIVVYFRRLTVEEEKGKQD